MINDELSQWCEIDGHDWIATYFCHGLILGPKTTDITRVCQNCKATERLLYVPHGTNLDYLKPIYGAMLIL